MPDTVTVRDSEGRAFDVPSDQLASYQAQGFTPESEEQRGERVASDVRHDIYGGVTGHLETAGLGALSGLTLGLSDVGISALGGGHTLRALEQENPYTSLGANILGALAPTVLTGGASAADSTAGLGARIMASTPAGLTSSLGRSVAAVGKGGGLAARVAAGTAGAAAEGSLYGGGQYLAQTAIEDKPLAAEGFLGAMGKGALFGAPLGAAGTLAEGVLTRARSLFPRAEMSESAAREASHEATSQLAQTVADGEQMAQAARQQIALGDAKQGMAESGERVTRTVFGQADPGALADQVAAGADKTQLAEALQKYEGARDALHEWVATEADPDLEAALRGLGEPEIIGPDQYQQELRRLDTLHGDPAVPVGEFGPPGARGIKQGAELIPRPPTAVEAPAADVTRALRRHVADGTPVEAQALAPETPPTQFSKTRGGQAPKASPLSDEEFDAFSKSARGELHPEEHDALNQYSNNGMFGVVNSNLRRFADTPDLLGHPAFKGDPLAFLDHGSGIPGLGKTAAALDDAISASKAPRDMVVYRGLNGAAGEGKADLWALKPGDSFVDHGFASTSNDLEAVGKGYTQGFGVRPGVELHIEVPAGHPIAPVPSVFDKEKELLLPRGSKFTVESTEKAADGHLVMRVRVGERLPAEAATALPEVAVAPESDLLSQLKGTAAKLGEGEGFGQMGAPARAGYRAAKEAHTAEAAQHFRGQALAARAERAGLGDAAAPWNEGVPMGRGGGYETSPMAAGERDAQEAARALRTESELAPAGQRTSVLGKRTLAPVGEGFPVTAAEYSERKAAMGFPDKPFRKSLGKRIGKNVDMSGELERAAKVIDDVEAASADLADALGPQAPATAVKRAADYRAVMRWQAETSSESAARAAADIKNKLGPTMVDPDMRAKVADALAREKTVVEPGGALPAADRTVVEPDLAARMKALRTAEPAAKPSSVKSGALGKAADVGTAIEVLHALGVHVPSLAAIPVIGPVLSLFLKARAAMAILRRKGGSIPRSTESVVAAMSAQTRDRVANATQALLGAVKVAKPAAVSTAAILGYRLFPGGEDVRSKDPQDLYRARMDDLARAQAPGAITAAVGDHVPTSDPTLQSALEQQLQRALMFVDSKAPKQTVLPGMLPGSPQWQPSKAALDGWAKYIQAVHDPASVLEGLAHGRVSMEGAETLRVVYPSLFAEAQRYLLQNAQAMQKTLPYPTRVAISIVYRVPVDATMTPQHLQFLSAGPSGPAPTPAPQQPGPGAPALTAPLTLGQRSMVPIGHGV